MMGNLEVLLEKTFSSNRRKNIDGAFLELTATLFEIHYLSACCA
jgi:hypothetical protein